jgi:ABC-2 type transport system permease protein
MITNPVGVITLAKREIYRFLVVSTQTIYPPLVSSFLFMLIFGVAIGSRIDFSSGGLSYFQFIIPGLMAMHMISSAYENTSSSLFIARWHNHIQEVLLSPLSYFEMVLGLLAGGVARGVIVSMGVYVVSVFFVRQPIYDLIILSYFIIMVTVIFSCAGMMSALWAEDFGMLNIWNTYLIVPMTLIGGVFHPMSMFPEPLRVLAKFNPMFYLVNGMRYSITGFSDTSIFVCVFLAFIMAVSFFFFTVFLFKIGYKLRT